LGREAVRAGSAGDRLHLEGRGLRADHRDVDHYDDNASRMRLNEASSLRSLPAGNLRRRVRFAAFASSVFGFPVKSAC
jgi:hypothetical protein